MKKLSYILLSGLMLILSACEKDTESANFAPVVTTGTASNIYRMGATLSGSITLTETNTAQSYGILLSNFESMAEATEYPVKDGSSNYNVLVQNLEPGETYYYCAYASSGYSTAKSQIKSFTTPQSNAPVFNEVILQSKDEKSCVVSTELLDDGGSELLMTGFVWGEAGSGDPTIKSNVVNVEPQGSRLSATIKGMEPNKTYLVRAYGVNAQGVGYSNSVSVTTNTATVPVLSDIIASDSTEVSVTVHSTIVDAGLGEVTKYGFCYSSESKEPTTAHLVVENVEGDSKNFSALIDGLKPETTYYIRAYAINEKGIGYSEVFVYTTKAPTEPGIYSLEDLIAFRDAVNAGEDLSKWVTNEVYINLYADIDASSIENWIPINNLRKGYCFEGNENTISLKKTTVYYEEYESWGFIINNEGFIQNLNINLDMPITTSVSGNSRNGVSFASVCVSNQGNVVNCHVTIENYTDSYGVSFGGVVNENSETGIISQCSVKGTAIVRSNIGGIADSNRGGIINNCQNYLSIEYVNSSGDAIGGIAAYNMKNGKIEYCTNYGNLKETSNAGFWGVGGIVGRLFNGTIDNCQNNGNLDFPRSDALGGIAGKASETDSSDPNNTTRIVTNCINTGDIVGPDGVTGNMIGILDGAESQMTGCTYGGTVNGAAGTETNAIGNDMRVKGEYSNGVVTLQEAGTLASLIPESEKYSIIKLKVVGLLNGDDIRYLREMAGRDVNGNETTGSLIDLDMSEATIVEGGEAYFASYFTTNNKVGEDMFYETHIEKILLPENITEIGSSAFYGCSSLTNITIPKGITKIASSIFRDCSALTSIILPNEVTEIVSSAFYGCSSLTNITIPNGVTKISDHTFYGCTSLAHIILPDGVTEIGGFAFGACSSLTEINIPDGVTIINNFTFLSCSSLKSIILPSTITSIGKEAFDYCSSLSEVTSKATTPPALGTDVFLRIASPATLYVPTGCANTYKATDWANYFSVIKAEGETESNDANINDIPTEEW